MNLASKGRYLIPLASIVVGLLFAVLSVLDYEIINPTKGPMLGFMPFIVGLLLTVVGVLDLLQARKNVEPIFLKDNFLFIFCVAATIAASYLIGLLPAGYLFSFGWLKTKERCSWAVTIITMVFLLVLILGVFVFWLDIPFEYGIFERFRA